MQGGIGRRFLRESSFNSCFDDFEKDYLVLSDADVPEFDALEDTAHAISGISVDADVLAFNALNETARAISSNEHFDASSYLLASRPAKKLSRNVWTTGNR